MPDNDTKYEQRIDVTVDKLGRWVEVDASRALAKDADDPSDPGLWRVSLGVQRDPAHMPQDHWTWLTPVEARAVAHALKEAAERAESAARAHG